MQINNQSNNQSNNTHTSVYWRYHRNKNKNHKRKCPLQAVCIEGTIETNKKESQKKISTTGSPYNQSNQNSFTKIKESRVSQNNTTLWGFNHNNKNKERKSVNSVPPPKKFYSKTSYFKLNKHKSLAMFSVSSVFFSSHKWDLSNR